MAELKTRPNKNDVTAYLATLGDDQRSDSEQLVNIMQEIIGEPPVMWGTSIIGFGSKHLKYESGRELDWPIIGFAARKSGMVIYSLEYLENYRKELDKVGKYKIGKGCLYIKRLADVDTDKLQKFIKKLV